MTFFVGEDCIQCKLTDCVTVCPVDCFYEGNNFLVIDPDECIDCGLCEPECPAEAIFSEDDIYNPDGTVKKGKERQEPFIEINAELSKEWAENNITQMLDEPIKWEESDAVENKIDLLDYSLLKK